MELQTQFRLIPTMKGALQLVQAVKFRHCWHVGMQREQNNPSKKKPFSQPEHVPELHIVQLFICPRHSVQVELQIGVPLIIS